MITNNDPRLKRHEFAVMFAFICAISGLSTALSLSTPSSYQALLPDLVILIWGWALFVSAGTALVGMLDRKRERGVHIERIGVLLCGYAAVYYLGVVFLYAGLAALFPIGIVALFVGACFKRARAIKRLLRDARLEAAASRVRKEIE